jgi:hypothetical protein
MINNAATTYLMLQASQNNAYPYHGSHLLNVIVGIPLLLIMLFLSIGLVLDVVFKWEAAFDYMIKAVSILMLIAVVGLIVSLFL